MKIICIGRNYAEHAKELKNEVPTKPVIFMKPDTALLRAGQDFYMPDFSSDIHHEIELVLKVCKEGKHITEKFAHKYYDEIGLGIDFTARDIQTEHKTKGLPWELAKAFDGSAPIGSFIPKSDIKDLNNINFSLKKNENTVQEGNTEDLLFSFDYIISFVSQYITLRKGDLIYTGTPQGVGPVKSGDKLQGYIENKIMLELLVK
jgi:2-keto-4-pentenoate hydratase/2-oxohepta-3-ene-1,7-dioic acid hydratase in catechol pathway